MNPFLGELFIGHWPDKSNNKSLGDTVLISEQVSHHPPITAYYIKNEKNGISLQGHNGQKSGFTGRTLTVKQVGQALLQVEKFNESFLITFPTLMMEGLIYASPYVELNGISFIQSSSGYISKIEYTGKGWVSGKKNSFKATLAKNSDPKNILYTVSGLWTDSSTIVDNRTKVEKPFWSAKSNPPQHISIKPIEEQGEWESRRKWYKVAQALAAGDYELVSQEKSKIENEQRQMRKDEKEKGIEWQRKYFQWNTNDMQVKELVSF